MIFELSLPQTNQVSGGNEITSVYIYYPSEWDKTINIFSAGLIGFFGGTLLAGGYGAIIGAILGIGLQSTFAQNYEIGTTYLFLKDDEGNHYAIKG
ncbi:hypothetical protein CC99x_005440 [Candidatus Berkiella cookevillensis]|uniref:Uncharacterized protein n=1 Tax=Candidatus Berkiella cookevillensis TaxID=437022 RepID=A0A0Q9YHI7_9GAMM|nr:hypothetical protein [Candidatus Berkiella cookevillensis]MCS5708345.1 hypothetical protein [Candidatus Berkiella cookevillensis]